MYVTADGVHRRYTSIRTEYKKLRDKVRLSKSGGPRVDFTDMMKWKVRRWRFLDPYIKEKRSKFKQELGKVSIAFG